VSQTDPVTPTVAVANGKALATPCPRCGRRELVSTTVPKRDKSSLPVLDPDGNEVPDGAAVHVCGGCGTVAKVRRTKPRKPAATKGGKK
jgi:transcription elongation factor Elf1